MNLTTVNDHIFDKAHLDAVLQATLPQLPPDAKLATGFGVDTEGVKVALMWTQQSGAVEWNLKAAAEYDWSGDKKAGIYGSLILT